MYDEKKNFLLNFRFTRYLPNLTDRLWLAEPETDGQYENIPACRSARQQKSNVGETELSPRKRLRAARCTPVLQFSH